MGLPIKKWPGVSPSKSSISSDKGVIGQEFRIPSICVIMIKNSSKVIFRFPIALFKRNLNDLTPASQSPPKFGASSRWHEIPRNPFRRKIRRMLFSINSNKVFGTI
ncbi:hypothetical protein TNCV_427031 [Trichonephila clavipes]|nr:hypothetical protein TNCV_427031 [Trichonephila clavipes]